MRSLKNFYHLLTALVFQLRYGLPARKLKVIGVTGTDGKTTTSSLIFHILKSSGKKVSSITTVAAEIGGQAHDTGFHVTTPDPHMIPRYLAESVAHGDEYFVFEITSHALDQNRAAGMKFKVGVMTNITHEHLDWHQTMEKYVEAKMKLINASEVGIMNIDDEEQRKVINYQKSTISCGKLLTYGLREKADYSFDLATQLAMYLARYNKYNFLAAYAVCRELGISEDEIFAAMKTYKFPVGRMEIVYEEDFMVISDFAHTPNAIEEALLSIREQYPNARLIHVFGAAAKRDIAKRPKMGAASGRYADYIVLTEEDYRDDDPLDISDQIATGFEKSIGYIEPDLALETLHSADVKGKYYTKIISREDAIAHVLKIARAGDVVVLTGKGHEKSLCRGDKEYPYNEKEVIKSNLQHLGE